MCRRIVHVDCLSNAFHRSVIGALRDGRFPAADDIAAFAGGLKVRQQMVCDRDDTISRLCFGRSNDWLIACERYASLYVNQPFIKSNTLLWAC